MIRVENLGKAYPSRTGKPKWVFRNLNFEIPTNANVGIIGRNGAGKSTLLRLIAGSDRPTEGQVVRDARVSWPVGFGGGLQGSLTGRQNAQFVCRVQGREHDSERILEEIKEFTNVGDNFDEPVKTYSDGMKARIKFAMSLAFEFDVYLSDEITSVGDTGFRRKAGERFRAMVGKAGLIMVSHSEGQLREFCDSGILIQDGNAYWHDDIDDALKAYDATLHK
ncbi:ABC transporter ATP-binding protein [Sphingomicrobium clamense]|uniref:ABC transporter ATP-binding protein n=1 Tax=Sphingomicrobium clamense TaxID=2851013 RepID=A0ABS6V334_9SPHN|nr:ABC transporter ATP-binding protein [Sphingomicrobium sp. B8]MBW0143968.1 ABC transporter ATP-binding protein [Sphingomicrobium sp. B8]